MHGPSRPLLEATGDWIMEFFRAALGNPFLQSALAMGVLAGVACGVVGTYVVTRRISYIAGAVSHSVLGGMGAAKYLQVVHGLTWCSPLLGAVVAAIVSALLIGWVSQRAASVRTRSSARSGRWAWPSVCSSSRARPVTTKS